MQPRDWQRSKVYAWEAAQIEGAMKGEVLIDIKEARALVDRILEAEDLSWLPNGAPPDGRSFWAMRRHLVLWKRGSHGGKFIAGGSCRFRLVGADGRAREQELRVDRSLLTLLHETAHLLIDRILGARAVAPHGAQFVRTLIDLVDRHSTYWRGRGAVLIESARANGIAVASESILQPQTQTEIAMAAKPAPKKKRQAKKAAPKKKQTAASIVAEIVAANPEAKFAEVCRLAVERGVKPNTARGALVRLKSKKEG